jgi:hypothetical protein
MLAVTGDEDDDAAVTLSSDDAVAAVLALPGVTEADHHGRRSFRVGGGRVLATVWDDDQLNVLVGEDRAYAAAGVPGVELLRWGERLAGVRVTLSLIEPALLEDLLRDAWARSGGAGGT